MIIDSQQMSPAEYLLWSYGVTDPTHIDLDAIANANGAEVRYRPLGGCEARLVAGENSAIISVSSNSNDGRQRFSLAHELAHWICDRKTGSFLCAKEDIGPQNAEAKSVEAHANGYASQLVLPTYLVDPWLQGRKVTLEVASQLGKVFNASLTAAAIKLVKRATSPACLACHSKSKLVWHQRSSSFPFDFYVLAELHQDTDAFGMVFGGGSGMTRPKAEPANRWVSGRDAYRLEVNTQSVKLPDSTVLTMISLGR
ncbi:ImmA/IrrE family metallo-endopeptidase [Sulfuricella sp.]|uniref:ImmA/IrrE family metallo-endopeptidase n=1 Tax=Sulfuricella sp. TaxID=2099377 RepID=UPI002B880E6D|nr:ImmA/IrrE family metallo-endopeptidase [Sulfuricella sp.]HUX62218.1 ImmA/IrrE family metallo-endopeptidase [Sulfuricella sp.]